MENGKQPITPINYDAAYSSEGLTKREYFAGLAMQGLLAGNAIFQSDIPENAVRLADKMLAELEKTKTK
jgi:hypothetical protein